MIDALLGVAKSRPKSVRATAFYRKLRSLAPISVDSPDMVQVEVVLVSGAVLAVTAAWHLPNMAHATTVQVWALLFSHTFSSFIYWPINLILRSTAENISVFVSVLQVCDHCASVSLGLYHA